MSVCTYEVLIFNRNGELIRKSPFDTYSKADCYYETQLKEIDYYFIQLIEISNQDNRKVIKEHLKNDTENLL